MEYCYHGTDWKFLSSIIKNGLKIPDGKNVKSVHENAYG